MGLENFRSYQLALSFHKQCQGLKLKGSLRDQLKRASESIVLNLAEGSAKPSPAERKRFYRMSLGSLREIQAIFDLQEMTLLKVEADQLGAHLYKLCTFR